MSPWVVVPEDPEDELYLLDESILSDSDSDSEDVVRSLHLSPTNCLIISLIVSFFRKLERFKH